MGFWGDLGNAALGAVGLKKQDGGASEDKEETKKIRDQLGAEYGSTAPRTAPTMSATAPVNATTVSVPGNVNVTNPTTSHASSAPIPRTTVAPMQGATAGQIHTVTAAPRAATAVATPMTGATIDTTAANQARAASNGTLGRYGALADDLSGVLSGKVPTAAERMFQGANDELVRQQLGWAAGQSGAAGAAALKHAAQQSALMGQKAANDAARIKSEEMAKARSDLAGVLGGMGGLSEGMRGTDARLATDQAGLTQGARQIDAQLGTQVALDNSGRQDARDALNITELNKGALAQAGLDTDVSKFTAGELNKGAITQADITSGEGIKEAELDTGTSQFNAGQDNTMSDKGADRTLDQQKFNVATGLDISKFNAQQVQEIAKFNAQLDQAKSQADLEAVLRVMALDDAAKASIRSAWLTANGQVSGSTATVAGAEQKQSENLGKTAKAIGEGAAKLFGGA